MLCPANYVTGGIEALHQLVDALGNFESTKSYICYLPENEALAKSTEYDEYVTSEISFSSIPRNAVVIIPEIWAELADSIENYKILWWLSYDNFDRQKEVFLPKFNFHICQSDYAQFEIRERHGIDSLIVSDYINLSFHSETCESINRQQEFDISTNPAKGIEMIEAFQNICGDLSVLQIRSSNRSDLQCLMLKSKMYIDFGHFPGKDRMAREAASLGIPVLLNRQGAAANATDFPLNEWYKFTTVEEAYNKASIMLQSLDGHCLQQSTLRTSVRNEQSTFMLEVSSMVSYTSRCSEFASHLDMIEFYCKSFGDFDGIALEFGVYTGTTLKAIRNSFIGHVYGFDSFQGLPEDWREGFETGKFATSTVPVVEGSNIIVGWFQDTLPKFLQQNSSPIAFIHFDADLYSSTIYCLNQVTKFLAPRSVFIFDEYWNYPGWEEHEHRAFSEWREQNPQFIVRKIGTVSGGNMEQVAFEILK